MTLRTVPLPGVPGLGGVYARGAGAAARLAIARRAGRAPAGLPDVAYEVRGVEVDPTHLTDYQHLLGEPASDVLPAGFVHVLAFPVATALMARTDFPLSLLGLVHLSNVVTQRRAVRLSEVLDVRAWAQDLRPHRAGTQVDLVTEVSVAGELVWSGVSTYLAKGVSPAESGGDAREEFVAPVPTGQWRLAGDVGRRYAAVSGDRNPIHLSKVSAKALGFPRAIAHGMYTAARALADVGAARGEAFVWSVEFAKPVLLPGTVTVRVAADDEGFAFTGWDAKRTRPYLTGTVRPL
ncbi:MaoC/PaaZ C-terminal domain-containing protein [Cellulomonas sp. PhB150]|uniref:MaoC/PaaZ C-terminal domain-containing protein n=1 Tax=Cellulomonas sp. PhB150 TaxID=2485188 RepID=UPI000F48834C|nr:MaoC/PaaZ C-terminal domain-containing protein [Cellulomonas sp. PhB150]ROS31749.1 acyl dehydratase [Cellulomonas sp. PhB150]